MHTRARANKSNASAEVPAPASSKPTEAKKIKRPAAKKEKEPVVKKAKPSVDDGKAEEASNGSTAKSVYEFVVNDTFGKEVPLAKYKGQVLLIVNIASRCGYTKTNYQELTQLTETYKNKAFKILSFPCNQFGSQMPQKDGDAMVCHLKDREADVGDVFQKINVNGSNADPLYEFLKGKTGGDNIKWNFVKFLVSKNGEQVERFASSAKTSFPQIKTRIDKLLAQ